MEPDRHVAFDERRSGVRARHACADVERFFAPQRREDEVPVSVFQTLPLIAVAHRALLGVDRLAVGGIRLDGRIHLAHPSPCHFIAGHRVHFHPVKVRHHRLHVGRCHGQRLAVHGATETAIDAVFKGDLFPRPGRITGEER